MVIVHTIDQVTKDKVTAFSEFTVLPAGDGLMVHGPAEQVVDRIRALGEETGAPISLDVFDGGECKHLTFNDTPAGCASETVAEEPEAPAEPAAVEPEPSCEEEPAIIDEAEGEPEESADDESGADEKPEAEAKPETAAEATAPKTPAAPKQEVTFKDHKERKAPPLLPVPDTDFTAEDAIKKLEEDKRFLTENASDCLYVLTQLSEKCKADRDFCQYVMREGKTFIGSYKYLAELARNDYVGMIVSGICGKMVDLSREASIPYFVEYFMLNDDEIARLKKEEDEKKKAEKAAAAAKKASETRKKNTKKTDPVLLAGIKIPDVPKAEAPKPAPAPAKPAAPVVKEAPARKNEQMDMFAMMGLAV